MIDVFSPFTFRYDSTFPAVQDLLTNFLCAFSMALDIELYDNLMGRSLPVDGISSKGSDNLWEGEIKLSRI